MALTALAVRKLKQPGRYGDGRGLYLQVVSAKRRVWVFRCTVSSRERWMGLGSVNDVSLAEAREQAEAARKLIRQGADPIEHRKTSRRGAVEAGARAVTFAQAVAHYLDANASAWRHAKTRQQWISTMRDYVEPVIGAVSCAEVSTDHVLRILTPIWHSRPETAGRLRGRIETVLAFASARGWRERGHNPAAWRGHLAMMLPSKAKLHRVVHHAAMPWREVPHFMAQLRENDGMGARAFQFAILTAARSGEVRGARWSEIDMDAATWVVPATRMKAQKEHRVPLSAPALAILRSLWKLRDGGEMIFHGQRHGKPMSEMTLTAVLRRLGRGMVTVHGFRSSFRDWAAEATAHPNHVVEQALAHAIGDKVEAAYRRGDLFEKRIALMADWAAYLSRPSAEVVAAADGGAQAGIDRASVQTRQRPQPARRIPDQRGGGGAAFL